MEAGKLIPSSETRERMFIAFGVMTDSIAQPKGTAQFVFGGPYGPESFLEWKKVTSIKPENADAKIEVEVQRVRWFLKAAALNNSLFSAKFLLDSALERMARQGGFERLIEVVMRQEGRKEAWFRIDSGAIGVVDFVLKELGLESETPPQEPPSSSNSVST